MSQLPPIRNGRCYVSVRELFKDIPLHIRLNVPLTFPLQLAVSVEGFLYFFHVRTRYCFRATDEEWLRINEFSLRNSQENTELFCARSADVVEGLRYGVVLKVKWPSIGWPGRDQLYLQWLIFKIFKLNRTLLLEVSKFISQNQEWDMEENLHLSLARWGVHSSLFISIAWNFLFFH